MSGQYQIDPQDLSITFIGDDGVLSRPDLSNLLFTRANPPGPSNSGTPVADHPQMENRHQNLDMGGVPDPSRSHSTSALWNNQHQTIDFECTSTHSNNRHQTMGSDCTPTHSNNRHRTIGSASMPTPQYISHLNPTYQYNQRQMMVDPFAHLNSGLPAMGPMRQASAPQMLPTGLLPNPSFFGADMHPGPLSPYTSVAPARTLQGVHHRGLSPNLVNIHEGPGQESSGGPAAVPTHRRTAPPKPSAVPSNMAKLNIQENPAAPVAPPTRQITAIPRTKSDSSRMPKPRVQEGFGGPIANTTCQENTTPKSTKAQQTRNGSAPAKSESATPKASKAKSEKPDATNTKPREPVAAGPQTQMPVSAEPKAQQPVAADPKTQKPDAAHLKAQKPGAADPKTQKRDAADPKAQKSDTPNAKARKPDAALSTTPKRRASAAHAQTPMAKIAKTDASMQSPVQEFTLNAGANSSSQTTTPVRNGTASSQPSTPVRNGIVSGQVFTPHRLSNLSLGQSTASPSTAVQQSITRYVVAAPSPTAAETLARFQASAVEQDLERAWKAQHGAALSRLAGNANPPLDQSSVAQESVPQNSAVRGGVAQPSPNDIAGSSSAQLSRAQDSALQQPKVQQGTVPAIPEVQLNTYPSFPDGDVVNISSTGMTWKLHCTILINASSSLKYILAKQDPVKLTKREREEGATIKWKLVMDVEPNADGVDPEGLKFKSFRAVAISGKTSLSSFSKPRNFNGMAGEPQFDKIYNNFFKCLYNIDPDFSDTPDDPQFQGYINNAYLLVEAAKYLDAIPAVRFAVEASLLRLNQFLWDHICDRPEYWIHLAAQIQSSLIFREAMIHLVGRFCLRGGIKEDILMDDKHGELAHQIWGLIQRKGKELRQKKLRVERTLFEYFPDRMCHHAGGATLPGRAVYSEDIYFWQSLMIVRQFCAASCLANYHHRGKDGGIAFYRNIASGNYMKPPALENFFSRFSMSSKGKERLCAVLEIIKDDMKGLVKELLVDRSQGSRGKELGHLTCTEVPEKELPWYVAMNGGL